jgi:hypothetical protein
VVDGGGGFGRIVDDFVGGRAGRGRGIGGGDGSGVVGTEK